MGRILKKKDPFKKRTLRADKDNRDATASPSNGNAAAAGNAGFALKKPTTQVKPKTVSSEKNLPQKIIQFLREVKIELKKVTWPSRKQTMGSTIVVIVLVVIISAFLGIVDFGLSSLIRVVLP